MISFVVETINVLMIHKEAKGSLILSVLIILLGVVLLYLLDYNWAMLILCFGTILLLFFLQFFRNPTRNIKLDGNHILYAPADGKIVVIEKKIESEYFKEEKMQISIFMSPLNVHVNRSPFDGMVNYKKYHKGKFLMAFNPKSSTENERCTTVFENNDGTEILFRQVAGFLARRIVNYVEKGTKIKKGDDFGFIKLGSRVDIFLPIDSKINVSLGQKVKGNLDIIAEL